MILCNNFDNNKSDTLLSSIIISAKIVILHPRLHRHESHAPQQMKMMDMGGLWDATCLQTFPTELCLLGKK